MPRIKEYQSQSGAPSGINQIKYSGEDFGAAQGRGLEKFGNAVQQTADIVYKKQESDEVSDAGIKLANLHEKKTIEFNAAVRDGKLDAEKFMQDYDNEVSTIAGEYSTSGGSSYFKDSAAKLRKDYGIQSISAQAELAGESKKINFIEGQKKLTNAVLSNPSSFRTTLDLQNTQIDKLVEQGLPRLEADKLKIEAQKDLGIAAVRGWIKGDPDDAIAQLNQGLWDEEFNAEVRKQLVGEANTEKRTRESDLAFARSEEKRALEESQKATSNKLFGLLTQGKLSPRLIADSNLDPAEKRTYLNMIDEESKNGKIKTDPAKFISAFEKIHLPDGDPRKIVDDKMINQMIINKEVSIEDGNKLRNEIQGQNTEEGRTLSLMKKSIEDVVVQKLARPNAFGMKDPDGVQQVAAFQYFMIQEEARMRSLNKSPMDLYRPDSDDYVLKKLPMFAKSNEQIVKSMFQSQLNSGANLTSTTTSTTTTQVPRKPKPLPGESIEAWEKRVGK